MNISAYYMAEQLSLKKLKSVFSGELLQENPSELFYRVDTDSYVYLFDYGAVVFANMTDADISQNLLLLREFSSAPLAELFRDDLEIVIAPEKNLAFRFNSLVTPRLDESVAKIAMLNVAHSVALDFYSQRAHELLGEVNEFTLQLEKNGAIKIPRKEMVRFIGRALNNKNRILENLFIFDSPEQTWEDEFLDRLHRGLSRTFEINSRFKEVEYTFRVVQDNLDVFRELYLHRESSQLEWIIIVLICIEVIDLFVTKLLNIGG